MFIAVLDRICIIVIWNKIDGILFLQPFCIYDDTAFRHCCEIIQGFTFIIRIPSHEYVIMHFLLKRCSGIILITPYVCAKHNVIYFTKFFVRLVIKFRIRSGCVYAIPKQNLVRFSVIADIQI